jgi:2-oxoisovalerate dehydrogenase E2 component (dihydrolipoyl transacylase)
MGVHVIKMPDIGEGIAEAEVAAWHVKPGDTVTRDQALADVMTDKATVEIPSPVAGRVLALGGEVGQTLAVGTELIRIEAPGEGKEAAGPVARREAARPAAVSPVRKAPHESEDRPIASPAVRRRAWELGIELKDVKGTGLGGRIVHADLDAHAGARGASPRPARLERAQEGERDGEEKLPLIGLRRRIAQKMQESARRIPHFTYVEEVDVTELEALRAGLNAKREAQRLRLTLLPFLARAIVLAVREFPQINARFDDEAGVVTRHGAVHIGIATQTDAGLMVPVLRHAEAGDLWTNAAEIARLADAARSGKVTRDELAGSTITITSLGALGGIASTPIINYPEVAILGVNRIVERPVMRGGTTVPRQMMNLSSSFDHRVVDGMHAAQFVQAVRAFLESPARLFME